MTESKHLASLQSAHNGWLRAIFETSIDGIVTIDNDGIIHELNPAVSQLLGYDRSELAGQNVSVLMGPEHAAHHDGYIQRYLLTREPRIIGIGREVEALHRDGHRVPLHLAVSEFYIEDQRFFLGTLRDMREEIAHRQQLRYQARHDSLTGLYNRETFEDILQDTLANDCTETHCPHWLAWLDLDGFKAINDSHGHRAGDVFLKGLTQMMASIVGDSGVIGRVGGDEFCLLLNEVGQQEAENVVHHLCQRIRNYTLPWYDRPLTVGVSAGLAALESGADMTELLIAVDSACYEAKRLGRNRVEIVGQDDANLRGLVDRADWAIRIPQAIEKDEFELFLMGIHDFKGTMVGAEVLLRLREGDRVMMPGQIISAAEAYGLMPNLDEWVIVHSMRRIAALQKSQPPGFRFHINCSTLTLSQPHFTAIFERMLHSTSVDPALIALEVTESATMADRSGIMTTLEKLRKLGVTVALDDFGQGTSSLQVLDTLPVDELKIDGAFIRDCKTNMMHRQIVQAVQSIAEFADIEVTAEFVEDRETVDLLKGLGVTRFQGFVWGQPQPWNDVEKALLARD